MMSKEWIRSEAASASPSKKEREGHSGHCPRLLRSFNRSEIKNAKDVSSR